MIYIALLLSALISAAPVLSNPANYNRAVPLTFDQFRYGFANAVDESEARLRVKKPCAGVRSE